MSPTLGYWFADVVSRPGSSWLTDGRPTPFWLAGFQPAGLDGHEAGDTRAHKAAGWALDAVTLQTEVLKIGRRRSLLPPRAFIYGLFLVGAGYVCLVCLSMS